MTLREPTPSRPRARGGRRPVGVGGFTLVEILVAIGIIVVLVGILLVGAGKITGQSKENATRVSLDNLRSMLAEYESKDGLGGLRGSFDPVSGTVEAPGIVTDAAYDAGDPALDDRYKSVAVTRTVELMSKLLTLTPNKTAVSRLSASQLIADDPTTAVNEAQWNVLLDGWGNPIIFVPGGGMIGMTAGGTTYNAGNPFRSRDSRPFWASAGPDGDFSKGDDNLYSFEN